jgi:hypothetical protein
MHLPPGKFRHCTVTRHLRVGEESHSRLSQVKIKAKAALVRQLIKVP